jgi:hypothetical protein
LLLIPTAPWLRARLRRVLAASAVLTLAASLLIGLADTASAATRRTWTFSGATFEDGSQMTGTFDLSGTGVMSALNITTSGGGIGTFGTSMTYDDANSRAYPQGPVGMFSIFPMPGDASRYLTVRLGDLSAAAEGDVVPLAGRQSYECLNSCSSVRFLAAGSIVAGPVITTLEVVGTPTITSTGTGTPLVGGMLTGDDSAVTASPESATKSYQWLRDGVVIPGATNTTYELTNDDAGCSITFQVGATQDGYADAAPVSSYPVGPVEGGQITLPTPTISGIVKVGQTLTADPGSVSPAPDQLEYLWYSDGSPVSGGTDPTLVLGSEQRHTAITVQVTATKAGYDVASSTSDPTGDVATDLAPDLSLTTAHSSIRSGEDTELSWTTTDADNVTASGAWTGPKPSAGTAEVTPSELGENTYVLSATNANGTTTSQVVVDVTRSAQQLVVSAPGGVHRAGRSVRVTAAGLQANEPYAITIGGVQVAMGQATATGTLSRAVTVPASTRRHRATITVTGSRPDRTGTTTIRVVASKALRLHLAKQVMHKSHRQWVTVKGLAAGEHVRVAYRGKRISPVDAHANANGVYRIVIHVGRLAGTKTVTARGAFHGRRAITTFIVTRH